MTRIAKKSTGKAKRPRLFVRARKTPNRYKPEPKEASGGKLATAKKAREALATGNYFRAGSMAADTLNPLPKGYIRCDRCGKGEFTKRYFKAESPLGPKSKKIEFTCKSCKKSVIYDVPRKGKDDVADKKQIKWQREQDKARRKAAFLKSIGCLPE